MGLIAIARKTRAEHLVVILLVTTLGLWAAYRIWGERVLVLSPGHNHSLVKEVNAVTDKREGGTSTATLKVTNDTWLLDYELKSKSDYPFAALHIDVTDKVGKGLDFSVFDEVQLFVRAKGAQTERLRLQLRNAHPDYTQKDDPVSLKYNEAHFPPRGLENPISLTWMHFQVSGWWIALKKIPFRHCQVDVTNVRWIEIVTPELEQKGRGTIELKRIEFHGKWFSEETLFKIMLGLWMLVLGMYALARTLDLQKLVEEKIKREKELLQLNTVLSIHAKEMKKNAVRDHLTGLLNRFGLRDKLFGVLDQAQLEGVEICAIFADIDNFKTINDTLGHEEGDRLLKYVAECFANGVRASDIVSRWGGEEFLFICQGTDAGGGIMLAEKLRSTLVDGPEDITCSFGVAVLAQGSLKDLIRRADAALYQAKSAGRNCVHLSTEPPVRPSRPSIL